MRKLTISLGIAAAALLLLAAIPQDAQPSRTPLKYGDRLLPLVGKEFYVNRSSSTVTRAKKGAYRLVAVGVDFAEFESEDDHMLIPLSVMQLAIEKE